MSLEFAKSILQNGQSRKTLYEFSSSRVQRHIQDYMSFYCQSTEIPGLRYNSIYASGHEFMGITREMPTMAIYQKPIRLTFILDSQWKIYKAMRGWLDLACKNINQSTSGPFGRSQRMNYYTDYVSDFELHKLENKITGMEVSTDMTASYQKIMTWKFINAYPIDISDVELSSEGVNQYSTFDVEMTYESYHVPELINTPGSVVSGVVERVLDTVLR
jgi:hypothetical protein